MKKITVVTAILAVVGTAAMFAVDYTIAVDKDNPQGIRVAYSKVVTIPEVTKEILDDFFQGKRPDMVLECSEGLPLPFTLSLTGDFLVTEMDDSNQIIKILKTCFVRFEGNTPFFSTDLQNWKDFQTFFTGMINVFLATDDGVPTVKLTLELNERK